MSELVFSQLIQSQNPEDIEKHIHKLLPNNPQSLQKIYIELASFAQNFNEIIKKNPSPKKLNQALINSTTKTKDFKQFKPKRHSSFKQLPQKSPSDYYQRNKPENITKRQQNLIRSLRQRGLRGSTIQIPLGLEIIKKQQQKISRPLQSNPVALLKLRQASSQISKCLKRFNLNPHFYQNSIKDADVDQEKFYDKDMKKFLDFRKSSLNRLSQHNEFDNQTKLMNSRRFSHVQSSVFKKTGESLGIQTMKNSMRKTFFDNLSSQKKEKIKKQNEYAIKKLFQAKQLIQQCTQSLQEIQQQRSKSLLYQNKKYQALQQKTEKITRNMGIIKQKLQFDGLELQNRSEEIENMIRQYANNGLIDKYTMNYMKMIISRRRNDNILANRKELIKNEIKFRELINEQRN